MKLRLVSTLAAFAAASLPMAAALAQDADEWEWARSVSSGSGFSVEVPCTAQEVALFSQRVGANNPSATLGTVACMRGGMLLTASQVTAGDAVELARPIYDFVLEGIRSASVSETVEISETSIGGRRALVSRELRGTNAAETRVIEVSDRSYVVMVGGSDPSLDTAPADADKHLRRYFDSLEIAS